MLQINYIRENKDEVLKRLAVKHFKEAETIIGQVIALDEKRRITQKEGDSIKAEANSIAKQIGELMKAGKKEEAEQQKARTSELKQKEKTLDESLKTIEAEIQTLLYTVPN